MDVLASTPTHRVSLIHQPFPTESPRDTPNLGVIWARHRDYDLGDSTAETDELSDFIARVDPYQESLAALNGAIVRHLVRNGTTVILPLYLYDHSGITISAGANLLTSGEYGKRQFGRDHFAFDSGGWDTSYVGFIFDTPATREECGTPPHRVEEVLRREVKVYASYLEGDVWGYRIERKVFVTTVVQRERGGEVLRTSDSEEWEEVESCWDFIGHKHARTEALAEFEGYRPLDKAGAA